MKYFDKEKQADLLLKFSPKAQDIFILVYNRIVDDMNELEKEKRNKSIDYNDFDIANLIEVKQVGNGVLFSIKDEYKQYSDATALEMRMTEIINRHKKSIPT